MNSKHTLLLISLATLAGINPCLAYGPDTRQANAMLGTQPVPVMMDDAAIQKAAQSLVKQQQTKTIDIRKKIPQKLDNPLGENPLRNSDKVLILGGAEIIPM
jgi:hypothetical protein